MTQSRGNLPERSFAVAQPFVATGVFLRSAQICAGLDFAFKHGWIDRLAKGAISLAGLGAQVGAGAALTPAGLDLMRLLLMSGGIVREDSLGRLILTDGFRDALSWRDLLLARLWFSRIAARDLDLGFQDFLTRPATFRDNSGTFGLFRYDRCTELSDQNIALTRPWVEYTSTLTRYEAPAFVAEIDLSQTRQVLDIGGNSGAFVRALCQAAPHLRARVIDLPVVCDIGREAMRHTPEASRITFQPCDLRAAAPQIAGDVPPDLVTYKSILHDWPEAEALRFLRLGVGALAPGGRIAVFERCRLTADSCPDAGDFSATANLVFQPFYRDPQVYIQMLERLGLTDIRLHRTRLDVDFMLITATKGDDLRLGRRVLAHPTDYPGAEISPPGRALLAMVEALDRPFGYEHSVKITPAGINLDRFVVSIFRDAFAGPLGDGAEGFRAFAAGLGADQARMEVLLRRLGDARIIHFGHEGGPDPVRKVYLEYPDDLHRVQHECRADPVMIFQALKWPLGDPARARFDDYIMHPSEADPLAALSRWDRLGEPHPAAVYARAVAYGAAPGDLSRSDVSEQGGARDSFDLNLYRLGHKLASFEAALGALAQAFGHDHAAIAPVLARYGQTQLGHIAGGWSADGTPFATVYFGIQGRRGTQSEALEVHGETP